MPELPEIALYKQYLDATALHQKIVEVELTDTGLLQNPRDEVISLLNGNELATTERLGKYLFIQLQSGEWLVMHFGMTGNLKYFRNQDMPKFTKMLIHFDNEYKLAFICPRKLGKIFLVDDKNEFIETHEIGRDALDVSLRLFKKYLKNKKGSLKGALTDQKSISGIGNVYADEIAFQCRLHPKSEVAKLSEQDIELLHRQTRKVLQTVIEKDAKREDFPHNYLTPHRENGASCPACNGKVKQLQISGRSSYFCPECQKKK